MRDEQNTSTSLLVRAQNDQQDAWNRIVALYAPLVFKWCVAWGLSPHDAENVGQEVFSSVARKLKDFERRPAQSFRGWLKTISRNKYVDFIRREANATRGTGGSEGLEAIAKISIPIEEEQAEISKERFELYHRAVNLIQYEYSERDWLAFQRVTVDGASALDVSKELGVSTNSVYLAKSRILKRLREEFCDIIDLY